MFARYRTLWARCVYAKDAYGDREFSKVECMPTGTNEGKDSKVIDNKNYR